MNKLEVACTSPQATMRSDKSPQLLRLINGEETHSTEASGYLLETPHYVVVFDRGSGVKAKEVNKQIADIAHGRKIVDIGTHAHLDHVGGVTGELWLPDEIITVEPIGDKTAADLYGKRMPALNVTRRLHDNEMLIFDNVQIKVIGARGHAPDHACYLVNRGEEAVLIMGDLGGGYSPRLGGDLEESERSFRRVSDQSFTHFVEGHGSTRNPIRPREEFDRLWKGYGRKLKPGFGYLEDPLQR